MTRTSGSNLPRDGSPSAIDGKVIASSLEALELDEPGAPLRIYIPRSDVEAALLEALRHAHDVFRYKGEASYYSLKSDSGDAKDAVWYYPDPCKLVAPIRDYLAFWGNRIRYDNSPA